MKTYEVTYYNNPSWLSGYDARLIVFEREGWKFKSSVGHREVL